MKILIVEDDDAARYVLDLTLKKQGHEVTVTKNGREALAVFEQGHVPLVISDMVMPDIDGIALCRRIRAAKRPQYTYIILLTNITSKSGYLVGMRSGADDFISKPLDPELLEVRIVAAERILNLQSEVKLLTGLIPICTSCKKVRDDKNFWRQVESFVAEHTGAKFSHSYCPECFEKAKSEVESQPQA
jgi:DNA-binding response OmpR family regulator